jgi:DNA-binding MarR family transcriptional regulator
VSSWTLSSIRCLIPIQGLTDWYAATVRAIPPAERLLTAIKKAEQATQLAKDQAVARAGVTKAQYNALLVLADAPELTGAELARRCFVTPQAMNETVNRLQRDGFIERRRHAVHQHVLEVVLTPAGRRALTEADAEVVALEVAIRETLDRSEQEALGEYLARAASAASAAGTPVTRIG